MKFEKIISVIMYIFFVCVAIAMWCTEGLFFAKVISSVLSLAAAIAFGYLGSQLNSEDTE